MAEVNSVTDPTAWAKAELAKDQPAKAPKGISEEEIAAKLREAGTGLTRTQAIEVLKAQAAHDEQLEAEEAEQTETAKKAAKGGKAPKSETAA